jgi:hypothetical protein
MRLPSIAASLVPLACVFLYTQPVKAAGIFFSASGSGTTCSQAAPCSLLTAVNSGSGTEISCADSSDNSGVTIFSSITIDCAGTTGSLNPIIVTNGATVVMRNFTMWATSSAGITLQSGTVILENIHITHANTAAILAPATVASTLIVKNCVFDAGPSGVFLKPSAGGSLSARFDHVTISSNSGGGIKIDTSNGAVTVDVTDSEISSNAGNGLNAVGSAGGPAMFSIHNSVIAKNGSAGVQVNGATAAAMIDTTLLDSNTNGATTVINGGHMLTYGNNRVVGAAGSGFTGSASLQ